jgi:hypothetical protein
MTGSEFLPVIATGVTRHCDGCGLNEINELEDKPFEENVNGHRMTYADDTSLLWLTLGSLRARNRVWLAHCNAKPGSLAGRHILPSRTNSEPKELYRWIILSTMSPSVI